MFSRIDTDVGLDVNWSILYVRNNYSQYDTSRIDNSSRIPNIHVTSLTQPIHLLRVLHLPRHLLHQIAQLLLGQARPRIRIAAAAAGSRVRVLVAGVRLAAVAATGATGAAAAAAHRRQATLVRNAPAAHEHVVVAAVGRRRPFAAGRRYPVVQRPRGC